MAEINLEFVAELLRKVLGEQRDLRCEMNRMRGDMQVMLGIVQRLDGTVQGLVTEVRAEHSRSTAMERRIETLEETVCA